MTDMQQGILRHFRTVGAALACLAFSTATPARDLAWSYVDEGARIDAAVAATGDVVALTSTATEHAIVRVAPDGRVAWRVALDGTAAQPLAPAPDFVDEFAPAGERTAGDRTCWAYVRSRADSRTFEARCLRMSDGGTIWERTLASGVEPAGFDFASTVRADGSMTVIAGVNQYTFRRIGANGEDLAVAGVSAQALIAPAFDPTGRLVFRSSSSRSDLVLLDRDGRIVTRATQENIGYERAIPGFAADGHLMVVGAGNGRRYLGIRALSNDGLVDWEQELGVSGTCCVYAPYARFLVVDGRNYLQFSTFFDFAPIHWIASYDTVAERVDFSRRLELQPTRYPLVGFDATRRAFAVGAIGDSLQVASFDPRTGARAWTEYFAGITFPYGLEPAAAITADGMLHVAADRNGRLIVAGIASALDRPVVRADQEAIDGAWYPAYLPGQGFVVDYIPATRTLFIPWFTFGEGTRGADGRPVNGETDVRALHWFSLQGQVAEGATEVDLIVYENAGGGFAEPPATVARRQGTARIRFESCDIAHLEFEIPAFDEYNFPRSGEISLTRLTPRRVPCNAAAPVVAARGFDVRQGGSWYDPATAGQGIMLTVDPDGPLFGAWFAYDPALNPDGDQSHQHWFTLGADLSTATNGTVDAPIYRTIGGQFNALPATHTDRVGTATLRFDGCERLRVDYRFDALAPNDTFRFVAPGTLNLVRLGGCSP